MLYQATKYTFTSESTPSETVTVSLRAESLHEVLEAFERFLKGAGFVFNGTLDIVEEESSVNTRSEDDYSISLSDYDTDAIFGSNDYSNIDLSNIDISFDSNTLSSNSSYHINEDNMNTSWAFPTQRVQYMDILDMVDDLQALHYHEEQKIAFDLWLESEEAVNYINVKLMDAVYDDAFEVES